MRLFPKKNNSIPRSQLIKYAISVCIFTIAWNIIEGVVSIFFGDENDSVSLIFFGVDSFIEVTSASLVLWRFITESKPDEEKAAQVLEENLEKERKSTIGIGLLFILLSVATISDAIVALVQKRRPETAIAGLIISSVSLSFMGFLWLSKKYLAKMLDSSTMASEAQCSLACIKITLVLFIGSLLYMIWKGGWWLDSSAAIILGVLFAKEGVEMVLWAKNKNFSGGCCKHDAIEKNKCCENDEKNNKKYFRQLSSFARLNFRKSTNLTKKGIDQEDIPRKEEEEKNQPSFLEKSEKCCGKNDETKQNSCCDKEIKDPTDEIDSSFKINVESTSKDIESQEKTEGKESSCACCHE